MYLFRNIIIIVVFAGFPGIIQAQEDQPVDTVMAPRDKLAQQLQLLRDSVDKKLTFVNENTAANSTVEHARYQRMTKDLQQYKVQLDHAIEEVRTNGVWNNDIYDRNYKVLVMVRQALARMKTTSSGHG